MPTPTNRQAIIDALPGTNIELAQRVGVARTTALRHTRKLVAEGVVHIGAWLTYAHGGTPSAVYVMGPGATARRPRFMTDAERKRKWWRENLKQHRATNLASKRRRQKRRDPLTQALFGPVT